MSLDLVLVMAMADVLIKEERGRELLALTHATRQRTYATRMQHTY
jgi:hypothetical protein